MTKPLNKKKVPKDLNQLAAYIIEQSTKEIKTKPPKPRNK
jgi:hypothetical protein